MRAILQRVQRASLEVDGGVTGQTDAGLLVLLGVTKADTSSEVSFMVEKILNLRIFSDDVGKMNRSVLDTGGAMLVVSQFTVYGDTRKGRRPSFDQAAPAEQARSLYEEFVAMARRSIRVETGGFQTHMAGSLVNDGPVTLIVES